MQKIWKKHSRHAVTRRHVVTVLLVSGAFAPAAVAGGGGGGGSREKSGGSSSSATSKSANEKVSVVYTRARLAKVKDADLQTAIEGNRTGHSILVKGYDKKQSSIIFQMMLLDRSRTIQLLWLLDKYTDPAARTDIVTTAESDLKRDIKNMDDEPANIFNPSTNRDEIRDMRAYRKLLARLKRSFS